MAITFNGSTSAQIATAASTWSIAFPTGGGISPGAFIVCIGCNTGVTVNEVHDTNATYTQIVRANAPCTSASEIWWANNLSTTGNRVELSLSGASSGSIALVNFLGISTANGVVTSGSSAINVVSSVHGASQVNVPDNGMAVAYARLTASTIGTLSTLDGSFAFESTAAGGSPRQFAVTKTFTTGSTYSGGFLTSSRCNHAMALAVFSDTVTVSFYPPMPSFTVLGIQ